MTVGDAHPTQDREIFGANISIWNTIDPKLVSRIKRNPQNVNFTDLVKVCNYYFGEPRQQGTSHCVYKTPWQGDPRVNIQEKNGKAKTYQVKQVLAAIAKFEGMQNG